MFNWADESLGIKLPNNTNPAAKVKPYKDRAPEIRYLSLPQIDEQLHVLRFKPQLQAMVATLIYAGLRREELLWLTREDVSLPCRGGGLIRVQAKTIDGRFWQPKTKQNRAVPISQALRSYLEKYTVRPTTGEWFFPSPDGKRWDADNFSADLRDSNREQGLTWTCLDYRHTFGSHLAQKGTSLYKICEMMGNCLEICRRHYASLCPQALMSDVNFENMPQMVGLKSWSLPS